ncbi:MAG TPA: FtsK/SpoIIIE domain-containing protein [Streptosporangiaceae bacterium]|nr:FtsK/SpoIIIE domain-containing protein [Streptosporangiaceae bacterium]
MSIEEIEREIQDAYARLAESATLVRYCHDHYLDNLAAASGQQAQQAHASHDGFLAQAVGADIAHASVMAAARAAHDQATGDLPGTITALTAAHPWALAGFGDLRWHRYQPDLAAPPPTGIRVGALTVAGGQGVPPAPVVARLAGHGHLLIGAGAGAGGGARSLLQAVTLRLAVATRPGTVRFALADPLGQGEQLSGFLRLPAALRVGSGVASSAAEIEALLRALTDHVVEVTQTRLTNVYDSVEAYNEGTTGVSVPYHVLVLAGFPGGISAHSAELLARLARNGPRAGVYIVATAERGQEQARGLHLEDLTATATSLSVAGGGVIWDDPDFGRWPIEPDVLPAAPKVNAWLDAVGAAASANSRDLPFARIAIPPAQRWSGDSTDGLDAQIGVDSKGEPQHFVMGSRGVHNGLVGGDVRMGKTNLLHVLITQLALKYPPEELELYLLDFKEVEFDAYLTQGLPHARAIASRTDREFGLSMLRRFHDEIERRARLCREARVTQLPEYRVQTGQVLPRSLVIMDEFQVLFSEEDRLSREAGALLADIAKRGAAFGLHLLLATQSPGGASLTAHLRPAYEQMALRIALGCLLPSVSQAILGEGNEAAAKLTRAGDAIYNDRRGEGANPVMRIAMLPTRDRLEWIGAIRALGAGRDYPPPAAFDPDGPADFTAHPACAAFTASGRWPEPAPAVQAWLGEAIEIKPATAGTFECFVRSNMLIVGDEGRGHGLLLATLLSAAVQRSPADVSFVVAEFARPSSPFHGFFAAATDLPHEVQVAGPARAQAALRDLAAELDTRLADAGRAPYPRRFFLVAGLHRWQELSAEGEWGKPSAAATLLTRLAEQGPEVGMHVVIWADSFATADRVLRRAGISQFTLRVALRLPSPAESDALLGVPAAASLADDRALFRDADWPHEQVEKFKPYSLTSLSCFAHSAFRRPA